MVLDIKGKNFFEFFSLQESFEIDAAKLENEYKQLQALSHPDKFSDADDVTRLQAVQLSSIINQAYDTLKSPLKRAAYLLGLQGTDPEEHNQGHLSESLLLQQMDWRDQLETATEDEDLTILDKLKQDAKTEQDTGFEEFKSALQGQDYVAAKSAYHKLQFIEKFMHEINRSEEKILDY